MTSGNRRFGVEASTDRTMPAAVIVGSATLALSSDCTLRAELASSVAPHAMFTWPEPSAIDESARIPPAAMRVPPEYELAEAPALPPYTRLPQFIDAVPDDRPLPVTFHDARESLRL